MASGGRGTCECGDSVFIGEGGGGGLFCEIGDRSIKRELIFCPKPITSFIQIYILQQKIFLLSRAAEEMSTMNKLKKLIPVS